MLLELIAGCCHEGIAIPSGEIPPPLSDQAVSELHAPPAPVVIRSVPPTDTTYALSAGQASFFVDQVEASPDAAKKFCPCADIFWKYGFNVLASAGVQPHEQPIVVGSGLCVVMALMIAVSVFPMYTTRLASPGAMPSAWVMSSVCSVSSQLLRALGLVAATQLVLVPSVDNKVIGTLLVWCTLVK